MSLPPFVCLSHGPACPQIELEPPSSWGEKTETSFYWPNEKGLEQPQL